MKENGTIEGLILMRPEIFEIEEPVPPGMVGSSTTPHKRNLMLSEITVALNRILRGFSLVMSEAMETIYERSLTTWFSEFVAFPESCLLTSAILRIFFS
jgi:adenylosuccinate lyase